MIETVAEYILPVGFILALVVGHYAYKNDWKIKEWF